ncbi:related to aminopeptidase [Sporisorium reilianum SRZ2]|uniref:Peptide hydrolase n=1 Tax=Sporisorium reilianum (strain SRZ2) TaxID=999809 RepID=E6ZM67_SPORE|nr:related to aminopeptidase [Sporisorium reilianum SRZ2]
MHGLKPINSVLLAALLALAATSTAAVAAPTAASPQAWTYWRSDASSLAYHDCATEVAKLHDGREVAYLFRAPSGAECVRGMVTHEGPAEVVLFKQEAVEDYLLVQAGSWRERSLEALLRGQDSTADTASGQMAFRLPATPKILSVHETSLLVAVTDETLSTLDMHATRDTRLERLYFRPTAALSDDMPKPEPTFKKPRYNSIVAKIASSSALSPARIVQDLRILTGESAQPREIGTWHSRHSATYGARRAGAWIQQQLAASLAPLNASCAPFAYSPFFAPNVVCHIPAATSSTEGAVVVSAHYDSRGTFGATTAPGGDDDGSGTAALLAIARSLGASALPLASPVQLIAFSGEEQGLVGSQHYAAHLRSTHTPVKLALQMDMLAYRHPGESAQIAFPDRFVTNSATQHVWRIADIYAPELQQGYTPACCSDHQSFWDNGFPATWVFERNGPIADPMYHNSGDVTNRTGYDVGQLASIAKVVTATLLDVAGFDA